MEWAPNLRQRVETHPPSNGGRVISLSRRRFTKEVKEATVRRLELGTSIAEVARACEVNPNVLHRWRRELREYAAKAFPGEGHSRTEESRIAELERKVGRQAMEIDFLRAMLAACRRAEEVAGIDCTQLVYSRIQKEVGLASQIPIRVMCRQAGVSRAGFYRWRHAPPAEFERMLAIPATKVYARTFLT